MATSNNNSVSFPLTPLFVLGVVFLVLKLTGVIGWSWWLVLLPFYLGPLLFLLVLVVVLLVVAWERARGR